MGAAQCYCQRLNNLNFPTLLKKWWGWWILEGRMAESAGLGGDHLGSFFFIYFGCAGSSLLRRALP